MLRDEQTRWIAQAADSTILDWYAARDAKRSDRATVMVELEQRRKKSEAGIAEAFAQAEQLRKTVK